MPEFVRVDGFYINLNYVSLVEIKELDQDGKVAVIIDIANSSVNGKDRLIKAFSKLENACIWAYRNFGVHCVEDPFKVKSTSPPRLASPVEDVLSDEYTDGSDVDEPTCLSPPPPPPPLEGEEPLIASPVAKILLGTKARRKARSVSPKKLNRSQTFSNDGRETSDVKLSLRRKKSKRRPRPATRSPTQNSKGDRVPRLRPSRIQREKERQQ
jgi:hypothetical protein